MYTLHFINLNMSENFDSRRAAEEAGRRAGFEFVIFGPAHDGTGEDTLLMSWSVFGGTRRY